MTDIELGSVWRDTRNENEVTVLGDNPTGRSPYVWVERRTNQAKVKFSRDAFLQYWKQISPGQSVIRPPLQRLDSTGSVHTMTYEIKNYGTDEGWREWEFLDEPLPPPKDVRPLFDGHNEPGLLGETQPPVVKVVVTYEDGSKIGFRQVP